MKNEGFPPQADQDSGVRVEMSAQPPEIETALIQSIRRRRIRLWRIQALAGGDKPRKR